MELDFGECNLRELPEGITALTKLRILRLDNNKLNHLPEQLFDALDLTELTSADNLGISTAGVEERMVATLSMRSALKLACVCCGCLLATISYGPRTARRCEAALRGAG
jgi:hypothetical protein